MKSENLSEGQFHKKLCLIAGDGIGGEVTSAAVELLRSIDSNIEIVVAEAGWKTFCERGNSVPDETLESISDCSAALFGAVSSPSKKVEGYRSAILKIRQRLDLFANIRPIKGKWVGARGNHEINLVIVRENSEGLYGGKESLVNGRAIAEKVVTESASRRIGKMAAHIAKRDRFSEVQIVHKANVLPVSEGLFRDSVRLELEAFPNLSIKEGLVDIVAHRLVASPESFQVIVTTNMFGDILSDLAAHWCGGMGRAPSLNLGNRIAVAEPVHGSAPDIAGQGIADPAATMLSLALLYRYHWNDNSTALRIENAVVQATNTLTDCSMSTVKFTEQVIRHFVEPSEQNLQDQSLANASNAC